jgi:hypothetical protein
LATLPCALRAEDDDDDDLSSALREAQGLLDHDTALKKAADEDAISWYAAHRDWYAAHRHSICVDMRALAKGLAFKNGLRGDDADSYAYEFESALKAQAAAE